MSLLKYILVPYCYADNGRRVPDTDQATVGPFKTREAAEAFNKEWEVEGYVQPLLLADFACTYAARQLRACEQGESS